MLSPSYNPFAVYVYNNGFGIVKADKLVVFDNIAKRIIQEKRSPLQSDLEEGKAYMQRLYGDFNSR